MTTLKPLRHNDIARCVEIEHVLFPTDSPWDAVAFASELESRAHYLGAFDDDGELVGYAGLAMNGPSHDLEAELHTIGVLPEAQGKGIGAALLDALLVRADAVGAPVLLEVRTDNEPAQLLYERRGFERVNTRRRYYQPSGADAYTMRRPAHRPVVTP